MGKETEYRNPIEVLSEEFLDRRRRGESLSVSEFADSHPEHSDSIRRLFPAMLALETCKSSRLSGSAAAGPVDLNIGPLDQLGDFRIVGEIGRGGMGVVFEAEQQSLQRRVAVKVFPRQTLPDSRHLERFHREAKTAARLHHTNIVPVFGVGEQDDLHYYVMQRIVGISLDQIIEHCAGRSRPQIGPIANDDTARGQRTEPAFEPRKPEKGDTAASASSADMTLPSQGSRINALGDLSHGLPGSDEAWTALYANAGPALWNAVASIGIQVAEALDYAHAQDVVHRDIKPSNLMLDRRGTVWVTDFGLAQVIESEQRAHPEEVAGTLRFMAPEHIGGMQDARSDIYSLGLTLYELLTLRPAFADSSRTRLLSKIMKGTYTPPREIRPEIPKDLEAIVIKAMARDSDDRYRHASDLGDDLRRFLRGRPVSARPLSLPIQIWRSALRNPVVAGLCVALLLTGITSFMVVGAKWKDAVNENRRAEDNLSLALESMDQILERFTSSWMAHPIGGETEGIDVDPADMELHIAVSDHSAAVLQDALRFYDRFVQQNPTNPQLYLDTAKVHRRVADIYQRLGQHAKAEEAYRRSLGFLDKAQIVGDNSLELQRAETINELGFAMYSASRFGDAEKEFRRALKLVAASPQGSKSEGRAQQARIGTNLAQCLSLMFRWDEARQAQGVAVEILENLVRDYPANTKFQLDLARAYRSQYWLMRFHSRGERNQYADKRKLIRKEAISILDRLIVDHPGVPDYRCELSELLITTFSPPSDHEEGMAELERAITLARELSIVYPTIPRYQTVLARGVLRSAEYQCDEAPDQAQRLFDESIDQLRSLTHTFPQTPVYRVFLAHAFHDQARSLRRLGQTDKACDAIKLAIDEQTEYVHLREDNSAGRKFLVGLQNELHEMEEVVKTDVNE